MDINFTGGRVVGCGCVVRFVKNKANSAFKVSLNLDLAWTELGNWFQFVNELMNIKQIKDSQSGCRDIP